MSRSAVAFSASRATRSEVSDALTQTLNERFGLEAFRPWQREAIDAVLGEPGQALVVAPTGGGKSLTYQFPAAVLDGTTIVVSPLIALMEDQVRGLEERGVAATFLASTLPREEVQRREREMREGKFKVVYLAPERLASDWLVGALRDMQPPLVAIDEAHCISQWGHDFRPDYLRIGGVLRRLAPKRVLACTATATPRVRDEILERLELGGAKVVLRGFARPNLHLEADALESSKQRSQRMTSALSKALGDPKQPKGGAIVYAATRKNTEKFASAAAGLGYRAGHYHGGMEPDDRARVNAAFAGGELDVVVATNAFGMGIDRADIRLVVHVQAPGSIEAYYQEVGRAGRDGAPAHGLLLSASADYNLRRRLIERPWEGGARSSERIAQQWSMFLDLMRYVEAGSCRHDFILRYFGDEAELLGGCGHCDVCSRLGDDDPEERKVSEEDAIIVRKALAGVARARGRVGLKAIAEMLAGKNNQRLRRWSMDTLSTFGLLKAQGLDWNIRLLRRLMTAGYADVDGGEYPVVAITSRGVAVMKGEQPVRVFPPDEKTRTPVKKSGGYTLPADLDPVLFEALRSRRAELAKEKGVPAYVVCTDRSLADIVSRRPHDPAALVACYGMGPARVDAWGEGLLEVLRENA